MVQPGELYPVSWDRPGWTIIKEKECVYKYDWITLLYSRNWYNIVNQLYFFFLKKRKINKAVLGGGKDGTSQELGWMGEFSNSAGAYVAATTTLARGLPLFSETEHTLYPASLLLVRHQTAPCTRAPRNTEEGIQAAFLMITPDQTAARCPSALKRANTLWFSHTMGYGTQPGGSIYCCYVQPWDKSQT